VNGKSSVWRHLGPRAVAVGVVLTLAPLPARAAEPTQAVISSIDFSAAVQKYATPARPAAGRRDSAQSPNAAPRESGMESGSFFRSPLGVAVIAIVGAGTAYALYSAKHDRIHSTTR
jgi:hypothetical protein